MPMARASTSFGRANSCSAVPSAESTTAILCMIGFAIGYGTTGLISAALAAAMVLFFYGVGQYVMVLFADAGARTLLTVVAVQLYRAAWSASGWCLCCTTHIAKRGRC